MSLVLLPHTNADKGTEEHDESSLAVSEVPDESHEEGKSEQAPCEVRLPLGLRHLVWPAPLLHLGELHSRARPTQRNGMSTGQRDRVGHDCLLARLPQPVDVCVIARTPARPFAAVSTDLDTIRLPAWLLVIALAAARSLHVCFDALHPRPLTDDIGAEVSHDLPLPDGDALEEENPLRSLSRGPACRSSTAYDSQAPSGNPPALTDLGHLPRSAVLCTPLVVLTRPAGKLRRPDQWTTRPGCPAGRGAPP